MNITDMTSLKKAIEAGESFYLIDVRTKREFASSHIIGALNFPLGNVHHLCRKNHIPLDAPVVLYCRSGHRSGLALRKLLRRGYTNVSNAGGILDADPSLIEKD